MCPGSSKIPQVLWQWDFVKEGMFLCCSHCQHQIFYPINRVRNNTTEPAIGVKPDHNMLNFMEMVVLSRWVKTPHELLEIQNEKT